MSLHFMKNCEKWVNFASVSYCEHFCDYCYVIKCKFRLNCKLLLVSEYFNTPKSNNNNNNNKAGFYIFLVPITNSIQSPCVLVVSG